MQYIVNDLIQLNSDVIRVFKKIYKIEEAPELSEIVNNEVEFYAHCVTKLGIKLGCWEKIGNIKYDEKPFVIFRDTNDHGSKPGKQIEISKKWYVWQIGDFAFRRVGVLLEENQKAEIGIVINPLSIVHRIKTGCYDFRYPGY